MPSGTMTNAMTLTAMTVTISSGLMTKMAMITTMIVTCHMTMMTGEMMSDVSMHQQGGGYVRSQG